MLPRRIANRYAQALFALAQEQNTTAQWEPELASLAAIFDASPELREVLAHPEIPLRRKMEILEQVFHGKVAPPVLMLLERLLKRGHDLDIDTIHAIYLSLWNTARRVVSAAVTSAVPLSDAQAQRLTAILAKRTGATVQLARNVDPSLIAGMVVTIGDRVIDASAAGTFAVLRDTMEGAS
jgi:F-type H+-transporting ATPase subunit delta